MLILQTLVEQSPQNLTALRVLARTNLLNPKQLSDFNVETASQTLM